MGTENKSRIGYLRKKIFMLVICAMFGSLMYVSKLVMEFLPNVHLIAMFIVILTLVYRGYALIPIYIFVFLSGLFGGFGTWWIPYLYVWTVLWGVVMLLPKKMKPKIAVPVYITVAALHGILFGVLYAPAQALLFGFDFKTTVAWVISGLPFDVVHMIGNIVSGTLIYPMYKLLLKLDSKY